MKIPKAVLITKKVYDVLVPSGKILQDMDKKHKFSDQTLNKRVAKPSILDILATIGVLSWMFMLKWLLDFLGVYGEVAFFLLIPLSALSHMIGEMHEFYKDESNENKKFSSSRILEIFLLQLIYVGIAFFSLRGFIGHTILADIVAEDIGWLVGSPFQYELAVYHLGLGVMGLISIWRRDSLWIGMIYAKSIFLLGAAGVHIWDIIANGNFSRGNFGTVLFVNDLIIPITAIVLLHIHLANQKKLKLEKTPNVDLAETTS
ncbi:MAG: hypothetical protein GOP50_13485 [Candidatus Heimdallarchaeota archaeon]|nr:hypothetical protein [Candidatus Heimdallarchaeota archaeon]